MIRDHRPDPALRVGDVPSWDHDASMMVMPLFVNVDERLIAVASAFSIGSGLGFVMSAAHNIMEAVSREPRFDLARCAGPLSGAINLSSVGLSVSPLTSVPELNGSRSRSSSPVALIGRTNSASEIRPVSAR